MRGISTVYLNLLTMKVVWKAESQTLVKSVDCETDADMFLGCINKLTEWTRTLYMEYNVEICEVIYFGHRK